jgi:hypothetical protein
MLGRLLRVDHAKVNQDKPFKFGLHSRAHHDPCIINDTVEAAVLELLACREESK